MHTCTHACNTTAAHLLQQPLEPRLHPRLPRPPHRRAAGLDPPLHLRRRRLPLVIHVTELVVVIGIHVTTVHRIAWHARIHATRRTRPRRGRSAPTPVDAAEADAVGPHIMVRVGTRRRNTQYYK